MKFPAFAYTAPATIDEACELLHETGVESRLLAGGQSLLPMMAFRLATPERLVDIGQLPGLDRIEIRNDHLVIGARVTHAQAMSSATVRAGNSLVAQALPKIGHAAIRTAGTVVGSLAHADPAAELPAVAIATDAFVVAVSVRGRRTISATALYSGYLETTLERDEIIVEVHFPTLDTAIATAGIDEVSRRHGDYAIVGLAHVLEMPEQIVSSARFVFFGIGATPLRAINCEQRLVGKKLDVDLIHQATTAVMEELETKDDLHGSSSYRRHLVGLLASRAMKNHLNRTV